MYIADMVEAHYTVIKRKGKQPQPLSLDEVKAVVKQKIITIRSKYNFSAKSVHKRTL